MGQPLRFAYITDTHIGHDDEGYHLHPRYEQPQFEQLWTGLAQWLVRQKVDFVIHGGDLTDHGSRDEIRQSILLCQTLGLPVYLCLGNHDLATPNAIRDWMDMSGDMFPGKEPCFGWTAGPATFYVVTHHWHPRHHYHWREDTPQAPWLDAQQLNALEKFLTSNNRPVILATHAAPHAVRPEQTGLDEPWHPPHEPYAQMWRELASRHPNLRLILSGHTHATSAARINGLISLTTAAFNEAPAQVRLITVNHHQIEVETFSLASEFGLSTEVEPQFRWAVADELDARYTIPC